MFCFPPRPTSLGIPARCIVCGATGRLVLVSEAGSLLVAACLGCDFDEAIELTRARGWTAALEETAKLPSGEWAEADAPKSVSDPCEGVTPAQAGRPTETPVVGVRRGFRPPRRTRFSEGL